MSELKRYRHGPEDHDSVWRLRPNINGDWVAYVDAIAAIEEARREAVEKERERIYNEVGGMATVTSGPAITFSRILDVIRGAKAVKVCNCGGEHLRDTHLKTCPCYVEPPKKVCTCWERHVGEAEHDRDCPMYEAPDCECLHHGIHMPTCSCECHKAEKALRTILPSECGDTITLSHRINDIVLVVNSLREELGRRKA